MKGNCALLGLALLMSVGTVQARPGADTDTRRAAEENLRDNYKDKVITLRHFYKSDRLRYEADGNLKDTVAEGPWTLYGFVRVSDVTLKENDVIVEGTRVFVAFDEQQERVYYRSRELVRIEIAYEPGDSVLLAAHSAMNKVFLTSSTTLVDVVPDYWKSFLGRDTVAIPDQATESPQSGVESSKPAEEEETPASPPPATGLAAPSVEMEPSIPLLKVSTGVQEAKILKRPSPTYPAFAKAAHIQGLVSLQATIGTGGDIKNLRVMKARGMGLEEAAIEAVKNWKYEPTLLKGEPVEVVTLINVVFKLR